MSGKYTVISTFAGGGGSSLGYKLAGFKELLAIEWDNNAIETLKANFSFPIWKKDIKEVKVNDILEFCNIKKGELDILDGSPPCQGFSIAGKKQVNDNRNNLFKEFVRLINGLQPKVFIMENVTGMIKGKMKGRFIEIIKELKRLNYNVKCKKMNAKYYNIPQSRERMIFIGIRKDLNIKPCYPVPNNKIITVKEALKNINNIKTGKEEISNIKILSICNKMKAGEGADKYLNGSYFNTKRVYRYKPSQTITKTKNLLHYKENRYLTINEVKKLCSFLNNFKLIGSYHQQWARLGNSVMPNMMRAITENIKINVLDKYYNTTRGQREL